MFARWQAIASSGRLRAGGRNVAALHAVEEVPDVRAELIPHLLEAVSLSGSVRSVFSKTAEVLRRTMASGSAVRWHPLVRRDLESATADGQRAFRP
jgi:hypothetical protein